MNKKGIMALALVTAYAFGANAQNVDYYTPGEGEGIAFFLPKTAVEVNVIATKVKYTPGDFCQYANRYLRINNVTSEPSTDWEIKKIEVRPVGIPDSTKAYIMKLSDKSVMSNIEVTDNNIIKAINTSAPKSAKAEYILEMPQRAEDGRKYMTEEILTAGSTAKMAEFTAKEIYNIRESKNLILRGQADTMPKDGTSLKLIMDNLEKQEKALVQMFTGIKTREDKLFTAVILPEGDTTEKVVMRFSQKLGVLSSDNLAGEPMYIKIENSNPTQTSAADSEDGKKKKAPKGIIYNIPAKANVMLTFKVLVNDLFNKKVNTRVIFDTVTGGIQKIDKD